MARRFWIAAVAGLALLAGGVAGGPPRVLRRVRRQRAGHPARTGDQGGVDQPARVDPHRRHDAQGHPRDLDGRRRHAQHAATRRHHARLDQDRHRHRRRRLQGQGRAPAGQRPRHHLPRRPHAVHGIVGNRGAEGRPRSQRAKASRGSDGDDATPTREHRRRAAGADRGGVRRPGAASLPRAAHARRHSRPQRHLAGEQHRELGPRSARRPAGPGLRAGRRVQRPAGPRRGRGRRDPVSAGGTREEEGQRRRLDDPRSRGQVLHAGDPARHLHAVSVPDRAVGRQRRS